MNITLERVLSLIPRKPDGKYVHGAKKDFCLDIGAPANIVNEWERGVSKSYNNYLYAIAAKYNVSVEWLKGETDEKNKPDTSKGIELNSGYFNLTEENKRVIDDLIERLLKSQSVG